MTPPTVNLDDLLVNYVGDFGRYQMVQFSLLMVPCIYISMHSVSWTFTGAMLDHRCQLSPGQGPGPNGSYEAPFGEQFQKYGSNNAYLPENSSNDKILSKAQQELVECFRPVFVDPTRPKTPGQPQKDSSTVMVGLEPEYDPCDSWVFDHSEITHSAVDRWDIVCDRKFWRATVQSMYYVGQALGSIGFGWIGDRWGRKCAFVIATWLLCFSSILMAVAPWVELFAALRLIAGLSHPGIFVIAVIMGMELVGPSKRAAGSIAANLAFSMGQIGLAFWAYLLRDYQYLQLALSLPCLLFLGYYWLIPGSIRWLIAQKRFAEADKILRRVARINGRDELPVDWYQELETLSIEESVGEKPIINNSAEDNTKPKKNGAVNGGENRKTKIQSYGIIDLFRTPQIRKHVLIQFFCWPAVSMVYYGISMDPSFLGGDRYVTFLISALIEIPGVFVAAFSIDRIGRKALMIGSMGVAGVFMTLVALVPSPPAWFLIGCVMVAKAAITSAYTVIYAWTPELFPTVIRNLATGSCSTMARIGGVMASYMIMLGAQENNILIALTFGLISLTAMVLSIFEPETMNSMTIETIAEAEEFGSLAPTFSFRAPVLPKDFSKDFSGGFENGGPQEGGKENGESCTKLIEHDEDGNNLVC